MNKLTLICRAIAMLATVTAVSSCGRSELDGARRSSGPSCSSSLDCPAGEACNTTVGICLPIPGGCGSDTDCASPTPHCRPDTHSCVECTDSSACANGEVCTDYECVEPCGTEGTCRAGFTCCGTRCVDTSSSAANCGKCSNDCGSYPSATAVCDSGACVIGVCKNGYADCDGNPANGCEANLESDPNNCSACNQVCQPNVCSGGVCVRYCLPGAECGTNQECCNTCVNVLSDDANCGGCGIVCGQVAHGVTDCRAALCQMVLCDSGYANCNGQVSDGCETNLHADPAHCGTCTNTCGAGEACISGVCTPTTNSCKYTGCPTNLTCCGTTCIDTRGGDLENCGGCGNTCPAGSTACQYGACCSGNTCSGRVCEAGQLSCNNECVDPLTDPSNCGVCNFACPAQSSCVGGECVAACNGACSSNETCCATGCADLADDPQNCGGCGVTCPAGCVNGECAPSCNGGPECSRSRSCCSTGCVDLMNDVKNCGACNVACPSGFACEMSKCTATCNGFPSCKGGLSCCVSGCRDLTSDPNNCGACGHGCNSESNCVAGVCTPQTCNGGPPCSSGYSCCAGLGCVNLAFDPDHCGACTDACGAEQVCVSGQCVTNEGALNPTVNPTYLSPGVHHYTSINIPAGVQVYVGGEGDRSGTLDLQSDGPIVIDGTIDVSGGPGLQSVIASSSTQLGRAGSGGYTGEAYMSAPASLACEFVAGNPGQRGKAVQGSAGTCPIISTNTCTNRYDDISLLWTAPIAQFGGGAGVFTGYRAYGSGGGGDGGGAPGALCGAYLGEDDCSGVSGGGGAINGEGGYAGSAIYDGSAGVSGETQCPGISSYIPPACVGGGGGGSIGPAAAMDLGVFKTFQTGSGGGGGSADYLNRPVFGGTSGGGGGGGALRLASSSSITINGRLLANGGPGGDANIGNGSDAGCDPQPGAAGGGGSGGVIYLAASAISVGSGAVISATGGAGGLGSVFATGGAGGDGGLGRIRLSVSQSTCKLSGSFNPPLVNGCRSTEQVGATYVGVYPN